eukprot:CAMPEP_0184725622 /NCGR_PEP_ID=MMETSP0314-20130426/31461_1 /TAXON_ID=38298 /ORGANISM="Rhodella maculata, Strain CCMP 736" /LENGTH=203 /DNA_ID=CAMNT_0027190905 /DNA_START=62 /DNA_END=673 /DNA_ORIENTATION=-
MSVLLSKSASEETLRLSFEQRISEIERDLGSEPSPRALIGFELPTFETFDDACKYIPSFPEYAGARNSYYRSTRGSLERKESTHKLMRSELFWKVKQMLSILHDLLDASIITEEQLRSIHLTTLESTSIHIPAIEKEREYDKEPQNPTEKRRFDLIRQSRARRYTESIDRVVKTLRQKISNLDSEIADFQRRHRSAIGLQELS